jgi:hypothetical protein
MASCAVHLDSAQSNVTASLDHLVDPPAIIPRVDHRESNQAAAAVLRRCSRALRWQAW